MSEELKPCPFCGGEAYVKDFSVLAEPAWVAFCMTWTCILNRPGLAFHTKEKAITAWNTRTPDHTALVRKLVEALEELFEDVIQGAIPNHTDAIYEKIPEALAKAKEAGYDA